MLQIIMASILIKEFETSKANKPYRDEESDFLIKLGAESRGVG